MHLYGNHKACERGDCQDGLERAGRPVAGGQYSSHKQCQGSSAQGMQEVVGGEACGKQ